ncbi:MAG: divalent-cation tolerance protein CutA [bacterium]|nr:divalent-cation tolerance protein CutA [bacterium]
MKKYFVVITTFPDRKTAQKICKTLINENLTACCQIFGDITSLYWWKGKIEHSKEVACFFKTEKSVLEKLKKRIKEIHPYEIPEIICLQAKDIDSEYAKWIDDTIKGIKND